MDFCSSSQWWLTMSIIILPYSNKVLFEQFEFLLRNRDTTVRAGLTCNSSFEPFAEALFAHVSSAFAWDPVKQDSVFLFFHACDTFGSFTTWLRLLHLFWRGEVVQHWHVAQTARSRGSCSTWERRGSWSPRVLVLCHRLWLRDSRWAWVVACCSYCSSEIFKIRL